MKLRTIAISVGCPAGVGPEVAVAAAAFMSRRVRPVLVGDRAVIERAARVRRVALWRLREVTTAKEMRALAPGEIGRWASSTSLTDLPAFGKPDRAAGAAQLAWIDEGADLVASGAAHALATGPVSKEAIAKSGAPDADVFRGHTEHLGARFDAPEVVMAFAGEKLVTALVTTHLALSEVPFAIKPDAVGATIFHLTMLLRQLGCKKPRVAVAALNPHAGEGGLLGREEQTAITPGIALGRDRLQIAGIAAEISGPLGAETAIRLAAAGTFDGVVAMYHDQATIPSKLLGFGEAVNVTLGLPIVRTSVDHGTAYDLAGTGEASTRGMREAIELAAVLSQGRPEPRRPAKYP